MAEASSAYFEAYRHVLEALKRIDADDLPFERHLVGLQTDVQPPRHFTVGTIQSLL